MITRKQSRGIQKAFGITELRVEEDLLTHTEHEVLHDD